MYRCVVAIDACRGNSWTTLISAPLCLLVVVSCTPITPETQRTQRLHRQGQRFQSPIITLASQILRVRQSLRRKSRKGSVAESLGPESLPLQSQPKRQFWQ